MKKMNNKGFIMVETLIVTVFVVTLFILIYQVTLPAMGEYERLYIYDDIDSIYASNLYKQMLTRYANMEYIDTYLQSSNYLDISDCSNKNIYMNEEYCKTIKKHISVTENDFIFITNYDISSFKAEVLADEKFDSGNLSNYRNYINTVPNIEKFSNNITGADYSGKYRLFLTRTIDEADATKSRRYVNIGLFNGQYEKYIMGEKVKFNPVNTNANGRLDFYVLKNSPTTDENVTLILANNLASSTVCFNPTTNPNLYDRIDSTVMPSTALEMLKTKTSTWTRTNSLNGYKYVSKAGYTIDYSDYKARLLDEYDIMEALGCKEDSETCYTPDEAFAVAISDTTYKFLTDNLNTTSGYWTSAAVPNSNLYAWTIKKNSVTPTLLSDCNQAATNTIGIRPVISVKKSYVSR